MLATFLVISLLSQLFWAIMVSVSLNLLPLSLAPAPNSLCLSPWILLLLGDARGLRRTKVQQLLTCSSRVTLPA